MIHRLKQFFCKQHYSFKEGDKLFKTTDPVAVVAVNRLTTIKGKAAYKVTSGVASKNKAVYQLELSKPQFTHGCLVSIYGFDHKFRVMFPAVKPETGQIGYHLEMLTKRGKPFVKAREGFHTEKSFRSVAEHNTYNKKTGKWVSKK